MNRNALTIINYSTLALALGAYAPEGDAYENTVTITKKAAGAPKGYMHNNTATETSRTTRK
jgi:hypothetical protein